MFSRIKPSIGTHIEPASSTVHRSRYNFDYIHLFAHLRRTTEDKQSVLTEAKDRAQLTATTAMSVVHVALLKNLLDGGPANNRFYAIVLALLCTSLALQVCAGFLAILVSHMKSYYRTHHNDMCAELWTNLCCCRLKRSSHPYRPSEERLKQVKTELCSKLDGTYTTFVHVADEAAAPLAAATPLQPTAQWNRENSVADGCPCICSLAAASTDEVNLARQYAEWNAASVESELTAAAADVHLNYLNNRIDEDTDTLHNLIAEKDDYDPCTYNCKRRALETSLEEATRQRLRCLSERRTDQVLHKQADILYGHLNDMRKNYIMKRVSFWQHILNYNLYTVFICNAFIAGFGVIGGNGQVVCVS